MEGNFVSLQTQANPAWTHKIPKNNFKDYSGFSYEIAGRILVYLGRGSMVKNYLNYGMGRLLFYYKWNVIFDLFVGPYPDTIIFRKS